MLLLNRQSFLISYIFCVNYNAHRVYSSFMFAHIAGNGVRAASHNLCHFFETAALLIEFPHQAFFDLRDTRISAILRIKNVRAAPRKRKLYIP